MEFYYRFYNRSSPYIVGLLFGYFMHKNPNIGREKGQKLSWLVVAIGWITSTAIALVLIYGVGNYFRIDLGCPNKDCYSQVGAVLYSSFARAVWGIVIAWIIFACRTGYGGRFSMTYYNE